jgi:glucans biosynthesis protein C
MKPRQRLYYLDNLRVFLTMLVIVHHTSITYGAGGSWYFEDVNKAELTVTSILLTLFTAVNQAFFMGFFFFLSGYFTPLSYDRKGAGKFLADRFVRLGIPLIAFVFLLGPFTSYIAGHGGNRSFAQYYMEEVLSLRTLNFGPLWFVETLLYFAVGYVIWRKFVSRGTASAATAEVAAAEASPQSNRRPFPSQRMIAITAVALGIAAFLVRLVFPTGTDVLGLQLGYFPAYILLFIAGITASRNGWLDSLSAPTVRTWFRIALGTILVLPVALILTGALEGNLAFAGGVNVQAFVYAMWEPFVGIGIILYLLHSFARRNNAPTPLKSSLHLSAYTAYIIHPVIVVAVSLLFVGAPLHPMLKFIFVSVLAVPACFAAAWLLRKLPYADRVL